MRAETKCNHGSSMSLTHRGFSLAMSATFQFGLKAVAIAVTSAVVESFAVSIIRIIVPTLHDTAARAWIHGHTAVIYTTRQTHPTELPPV